MLFPSHTLPCGAPRTHQSLGVRERTKGSSCSRIRSLLALMGRVWSLITRRYVFRPVSLLALILTISVLASCVGHTANWAVELCGTEACAHFLMSPTRQIMNGGPEIYGSWARSHADCLRASEVMCPICTPPGPTALTKTRAFRTAALS